MTPAVVQFRRADHGQAGPGWSRIVRAVRATGGRDGIGSMDGCGLGDVGPIGLGRRNRLIILAIQALPEHHVLPFRSVCPNEERRPVAARSAAA